MLNQVMAISELPTQRDLIKRRDEVGALIASIKAGAAPQDWGRPLSKMSGALIIAGVLDASAPRRGAPESLLSALIRGVGTLLATGMGAAGVYEFVEMAQSAARPQLTIRDIPELERERAWLTSRIEVIELERVVPLLPAPMILAAEEGAPRVERRARPRL